MPMAPVAAVQIRKDGYGAVICMAYLIPIHFDAALSTGCVRTGGLHPTAAKGPNTIWNRPLTDWQLFFGSIWIWIRSMICLASNFII